MWPHKRSLVATQEISRVATQEISCVATQDISRVATQEISCVATQEIACVATQEISCEATQEIPCVASGITPTGSASFCDSKCEKQHDHRTGYSQLCDHRGGQLADTLGHQNWLGFGYSQFVITRLSQS